MNEGKTVIINTFGTDQDAAHLAVTVEHVLEQLGLTFDYVEHSPDLTEVTWVNVRSEDGDEQDFPQA